MAKRIIETVKLKPELIPHLAHAYNEEGWIRHYWPKFKKLVDNKDAHFWPGSEEDDLFDAIKREAMRQRKEEAKTC